MESVYNGQYWACDKMDFQIARHNLAGLKVRNWTTGELHFHLDFHVNNVISIVECIVKQGGFTGQYKNKTFFTADHNDRGYVLHRVLEMYKERRAHEKMIAKNCANDGSDDDSAFLSCDDGEEVPISVLRKTCNYKGCPKRNERNDGGCSNCKRPVCLEHSLKVCKKCI